LAWKNNPRGAAFLQGGKNMSQKDGFASGFFAGAIFGSVVGGIVGALVVTKRDSEQAAEEEPQMSTNSVEAKKAAKRRQMKASDQENMEMETARRSLEDKIAQLNATIDEVRQQLGNVNGNSEQAIQERSSRSEELR
jgi:predicted RNase H-like nuclease (RuvC/YqgF family)